MWWAHVPKTSTTFSRTVFSYACGPNADDFASIQTYRPPFVNNGTCGGALLDKQQGPVEMMRKVHPEHDATWYHMPLPQVADPGTGPDPEVSAIMLFRKPAERLRSGMSMIDGCYHPCTCCAASGGKNAFDYAGDQWYIGDDWGWNKEMKRSVWMTARGFAEAGPHDKPYEFKPPEDPELAEWTGETGPYTLDPALNTTFTRQKAYLMKMKKSHSLYGCQTKYVLGFGCHEKHGLSDEQVNRALDYVSKMAAYVGIMERYAESVCLFHAMHGGPLYEFELKGLDLERLGEASTDTWAQRFDGDDELEKLATDHADNAVYKAAVERFEKLIEKHKFSMAECTKQVALAKDRLLPDEGEELTKVMD